MKYHNQVAIKNLAKKRGRFSERKFASEVNLSRVALRNILTKDNNVTLRPIVKIADYLERDIYIMAISSLTNTELSTIAVSYKIIDDGFESWKIHFMDLVDEFRRTLDPQLFLLEPPQKLSMQLRALLASIVVYLCVENYIDPPLWSKKMYFLDKPWFVSGMQSLKAIAIVESPLSFRRNNIFVHDNFLERV